jgi:NAD(P)-dependent dehydrogenase (short-subunit alcohol dehydrogenase family)
VRVSKCHYPVNIAPLTSPAFALAYQTFSVERDGRAAVVADLSGENSERIALVTGAARRIGRAIALRLARDGYRLALHASARSLGDAENVAAEIRASGGVARTFTADLADAGQVADLIPAVTAALGAPHLLVNNASLFEPDSAGAFDPAFFDRMMAVNLRAPAQLASDFATTLPAGASGCIINIIDQRVWRLNPQFYSYTLSKAALWTATQTLAQSFAPRIRVNGVGPGPVLPNGPQGKAAFAQEVAGIPLGRSVAPEEIADAVAWLAQAKSVTGQMIAVDGGQHIGWRTPDIVD